LSNADAVSVARRLMEAGGASRDSGWFDRVLSSNTTEEVRLARSVTLTISN
jgi:hypothetical protein